MVYIIELGFLTNSKQLRIHRFEIGCLRVESDTQDCVWVSYFFLEGGSMLNATAGEFLRVCDRARVCVCVCACG